MSSTSSIGLLNRPSTSLALLLGLTAFGGGLTGLASPEKLAKSLGPSVPATTTGLIGPFVSFIAARNLVSGLTIFALVYNNQSKALGISLLCGTVTAAIDSWICLQNGAERAKTIGHGVMAVVIAALGSAIIAGY